MDGLSSISVDEGVFFAVSDGVAMAGVAAASSDRPVTPAATDLIDPIDVTDAIAVGDVTEENDAIMVGNVTEDNDATDATGATVEGRGVKDSRPPSRALRTGRIWLSDGLIKQPVGFIK